MSILGTRVLRTEDPGFRANDWAIVGAAAVAGRVALANMGPTPVRARAVEQAWPTAPVPPTAPNWPPMAPSPARTSTPTAASASTWRACSPAAHWSTSEVSVRSRAPRVPAAGPRLPG